MKRKLRSDAWCPSDNIIKDIIDKYQDGISARQISFEYDIADVTIISLLKRNNIFIRNRSNSRRTNQIKENVFDEINEESAYWIGFILSDGNIYYPKNRSKQLNFGLKESDWEHLEKFKKFIGSNKQLYYNNKAVFLSIYSDKIVTKLEEYGLTQRKSKTAKVPEILKNNRHFWRGVVDGDGWIHVNYNPGLSRIGLCGTFDVINDFSFFIKSNNKISQKKEHINKNFYSITQGGEYGSEVVKSIYDKSKIFLSRKFDLAVQFCLQYNLCINSDMDMILDR